MACASSRASPRTSPPSSVPRAKPPRSRCPRAGVALFKAARAAALLDGRDFVIPDDVKLLAPSILRHRVSVAPELELEGVTADQALKAILDRTEAPTA